MKKDIIIFVQKHIGKIRWTARILAALILLLGLPFYFGYGNPLPFANPENSFFDNMWLMAFPIMFIGLAVGWKYEKIAGYMVVIPILLAFISGLAVLREGFPGPMSIPLVTGLLYLLVGYMDPKKDMVKKKKR